MKTNKNMMIQNYYLDFKNINFKNNVRLWRDNKIIITQLLDNDPYQCFYDLLEFINRSNVLNETEAYIFVNSKINEYYSFQLVEAFENYNDDDYKYIINNDSIIINANNISISFIYFNQKDYKDYKYYKL